MAEHRIKVPDLGEGIAEVELVAWHVQVGEQVVEDQALADVMTDKATVEIPSPVAGRVLALGGAVGQLLAVGAELLRIEPAAGTPAAAAAAAAAPPPAAPAPAPAPSPATPAGPRPIASPAVRARAWELGIALHEVRASGSAGRIMQADLDAHLALGGARRAAPAAVTATGDATETRPIVGLRRKIAQKMAESKRRIPHFSYVEEVDVSELQALRTRLNQRWAATRGHLTLLPFIVRATVLALREHPWLNARLDDAAGVLTRHQAVHLGIATQTESGLMVPVLRHAEGLDLWACAAEIARLSQACRSGKIVRDELSGSTLTISSLGALGGIASTPVINHPEIAIIAINRVVERPMLSAGAVVARQMMNLSSSFDHRVVDGLQAAEFVQALRGCLEQPALLFID